MWDCVRASEWHGGIIADIKCFNCRLREGSGASALAWMEGQGGSVGMVVGERGSSPALKSQASKVPGGADSHIMVFRPSLSPASATRRGGKKPLRGPKPL